MKDFFEERYDNDTVPIWKVEYDVKEQFLKVKYFENEIDMLRFVMSHLVVTITKWECYKELFNTFRKNNVSLRAIVYITATEKVYKISYPCE